jgi:hypothetical protein
MTRRRSSLCGCCLPMDLLLVSLLAVVRELFVMGAAAPSTDAIIYHVSPAAAAGGHRTQQQQQGSSNLVASPTVGDGSVGRPFRGLAAAQSAVRATLLRSGRHASVTVVLGAGIYTERLNLTAADSGTPSSPVVWRATPGANVLVSGGLPIPSSAFTPWPHGPSGSVQANLTALGLHNLGSLSSGGGDTTAADSTGVAELFFNQRPMHMARWPNLYPNGSVQWSYTGDGFPHNCTTACTGFHWRTAPTSSAARWAAEVSDRQPYLHGYWTWDWRDGYTPLTGVDAVTGVVSVSDPTLLSKVSLGARWHAINMLCELDSPGEYYIARNSSDAGMLYFLPPASSVLAKQQSGLLHSAFVSVAQHVVSLAAGASFITFVGINFAHSRDTIIAGLGPVANITIRNCTISNGGGSGISLTGTGINIQDSEVFGLAATAVEIRGGHHQTLARGENLVKGNHIHSYARWFRTYRPGILWAGVGNRFQENHIANAPHNAILGGGNEAVCASDNAICGGNDNIFEGNFIERVCYETDDSGAFYSCGQQGTSYTQRGNIIRNNKFLHVRMRDTIHLGNPVISGIYLDDGMTGWQIYGNQFIDVMQGVMLNGGRDNLIHDNYFEDVDHVTWLSDECKNELTYAKLLNVSRWPAWQKYKSQTPPMVVPPDYSTFYNQSCAASGNEYRNNQFCRAASVVTPTHSRGRQASKFINNTVKCRATQPYFHAQEPSCAGYLVSAAGSEATDGCYVQHGLYEGQPTFFLRRGSEEEFQLYQWKGTWKIAHAGPKNVSYHATFQSPWPPESSGGCGVWGIDKFGTGPCPAVRRVGLPPVPPTPPPPPVPAIPPTPPAPPMRLVFEDTFDGNTINTSNWNVATTVNRGSIYRASNVAVEDGALVMRTIAESYRVRNLSYFVSSGAVNTEGKFAQRYGRWQASVRLPRPNESPSYTLHSSIWLNSNFYARQPTGKGCADEIDVIEQYPGPRPPNPVSRGAGSLHVHDAHCVHMPAETGPHNGGDMIWTRNGDFTSKWTTFTLDWTPAWLSIRANNETLAVYTNKTLLNSMTDVQPLILTATVMERTPTLPDDVFPQEYWVDWVRIYEWL